MDAREAASNSESARNRSPLRGVAVVDRHLRIRFADASALALLRIDASDVELPSLLGAVHQDYHAYVASEVLLAISTASDTVARAVVRAGASADPLEFQFHKLAGDDDAVLATVSAETNPPASVSESLSNVNDAHSLYWELVESVPVALAVLDPEAAKVVRFNRRFSEIMGVRNLQPYGTDVSQWVPDFVPGTFEARMQRVLAEGEYGMERALLREDGTSFFARLRFRAFELNGQPRVLIAAADISAEVAERAQMVDLMQSTASLRSDAAFANLVARLATLLASDVLAIIELPDDDQPCLPRVIAVNDVLVDPTDYVFDIEALDLLGSDQSMVSGDAASVLLERVPALRLSGADSCVSVPLQSGDDVIGYLICLKTRILFDFERARAMLAICAPLVAAELMHERKADALHDMNHQMQHAQRLESLGLLAGGIAHDFNNLLTTMMGHADLARLHARPGSEGEHYLTQVGRSAARAAELCSQMLAYAGKGQFAVDDVAVNTVVQDIGELMEVSVPNATKLRQRLGESLPLVRGDRAQLTQVMMNLITNAADAMPDEGGEIMVRTGELDWYGQLAQANVVGMLAPGRYVYLEVSDTGLGIPPDLKQRIFDPFFSTKERGRGLGLATVFGIVRGHRGGLLLQSTPGHGSSFKVLLPALSSSVTLPDALDPSAGALASVVNLAGVRSGRTLVVDDEPSVRGTICAYLQHLGFDTNQAIDGIDGLEQLDDGDYDLVMLDLTMPRLGGAKTLARLRALPNDVPVILMSGFAHASIQAELLRTPRTYFMHKPFSLADLSKAVDALLASRDVDN